MHAALVASLIAAVSLTLAACDPAPGEFVDADDEVQLRPGGTNGGVWLNTSHMNIDEIDTAKQLHDGVTLKHVKIKVGNKMKALDQVWAVDGELFGKIGPTTYRGAAFLDAEVQVYNQEYGANVNVWITSYSPGSAGAPPSYQLKQSYFNNQVVYVCNREDSVGPYESYVFSGMTVSAGGDIAARANTLYLGCHKGAVGKAGTWGYLPWDLGLDDFEAVVRAVRADYCGDGVSHTQPGIAVSVRDVWGVNDFAAQVGPTDAVWGPDGALCLGQPRDPTISASTLLCDGAPLPTCPADLDLSTYPDALVWVKAATPV
jgi:hypothetical protein